MPAPIYGEGWNENAELTLDAARRRSTRPVGSRLRDGDATPFREQHGAARNHADRVESARPSFERAAKGRAAGPATMPPGSSFGRRCTLQEHDPMNQVLDGEAEGEELAERVPAQVVLFLRPKRTRSSFTRGHRSLSWFATSRSAGSPPSRTSSLVPLSTWRITPGHDSGKTDAMSPDLQALARCRRSRRSLVGEHHPRTDQSSQSGARARANGGGSAGRLRRRSSLRARPTSSIPSTKRMRPPQLAHSRGSMSKTLGGTNAERRAKNWVGVMRRT
jgi:hypothetical protein